MTEKTQKIKKVVKTQNDKLRRVLRQAQDKEKKVEKPKGVELKKAKVQPAKAKVVKKKVLRPIRQTQGKQAQDKVKAKPYTLRTQETGDKVFLIKDGKRYWVMNPLTLNKLGIGLGQEKMVTFEELRKFPEGSPVDLTKAGETVKKVEEKMKEEKKETDKKKKEQVDKPYKVWS